MQKHSRDVITERYKMIERKPHKNLFIDQKWLKLSKISKLKQNELELDQFTPSEMFSKLLFENGSEKRDVSPQDMSKLYQSILYHLTHYITTSNSYNALKNPNTSFQNLEENETKRISNEEDIDYSQSPDRIASIQKIISSRDIQVYFSFTSCKFRQLYFLENLRYEILSLCSSTKNISFKALLLHYHSVVHFICLIKQGNLKTHEIVSEWLNANYETDDPIVHAMRGNWDKLSDIYPEFSPAISELVTLLSSKHDMSVSSDEIEFNDFNEIDIKTYHEGANNTVKNISVDTFDAHKRQNIWYFMCLAIGLKQVPVLTQNSKHNILYRNWYFRNEHLIPKEIKDVFLGREKSFQTDWAENLCFQLWYNKEQSFGSKSLDNILQDYRIEYNLFIMLLKGDFNVFKICSDEFLQIVLVFGYIINTSATHNLKENLIMSFNQALNKILENSQKHGIITLCKFALMNSNASNKICKIFRENSDCSEKQLEIVDFCRNAGLDISEMIITLYKNALKKKNFVDALAILKKYNLEKEITFDVVKFLIESDLESSIINFEHLNLDEDLKRFVVSLNHIIIHEETMEEPLTVEDIIFLMQIDETIHFFTSFFKYIIKYYKSNRELMFALLDYIKYSKKDIELYYEDCIEAVCDAIKKKCD